MHREVAFEEGQYLLQRRDAQREIDPHRHHEDHHDDRLRAEVAGRKDIRERVRQQDADDGGHRGDREAVEQGADGVRIREEADEVHQRKLSRTVREGVVDEHRQRCNHKQNQKEHVRDAQIFSGETHKSAPFYFLIVKLIFSVGMMRPTRSPMFQRSSS